MHFLFFLNNIFPYTNDRETLKMTVLVKKTLQASTKVQSLCGVLNHIHTIPLQSVACSQRNISPHFRRRLRRADRIRLFWYIRNYFCPHEFAE